MIRQQNQRQQNQRQQNQGQQSQRQQSQRQQYQEQQNQGQQNQEPQAKDLSKEINNPIFNIQSTTLNVTINDFIDDYYNKLKDAPHIWSGTNQHYIIMKHDTDYMNYITEWFTTNYANQNKNTLQWLYNFSYMIDTYKPINVSECKNINDCEYLNHIGEFIIKTLLKIKIKSGYFGGYTVLDLAKSSKDTNIFYKINAIYNKYKYMLVKGGSNKKSNKKSKKNRKSRKITSSSNRK